MLLRRGRLRLNITEHASDDALDSVTRPIKRHDAHLWTTYQTIRRTATTEGALKAPDNRRLDDHDTPAKHTDDIGAEEADSE